MDKISFDKLYNYLLTDNHLDTANSFVSMMNDLPQYLAQRIFDCYSKRCHPFENVWLHPPQQRIDAVFEKVMIGGVYFKMDIWCNTRTYNVLFWAPHNEDLPKLESYESIKDFLQEKGITAFNDYRIESKIKLGKDIPITTSSEVIIDEILDQLRSIADR